MSGFVVQLREQKITYGPFATEEEAQGFAVFLTCEVDPAEVHRLRSPVLELLSWRETVLPDITPLRRHVPGAGEHPDLTKDVTF